MRASTSRVHSSAPAGTRQTVPAERRRVDRSTAVDLYFTLLRQCIADCGHTLDSLAAAMAETLGAMDRGYLHRLLNDPIKQREWKVAHYLALPDDVEALFDQRRAEAWGRIVVAPDDDAEQAARHLVSGMLGLFAARLPLRAGKPVKAEL